MASSGTALEGRDRISDKLYDADIWVVPYTNAQDSLDASSVYADLTIPTGSGMTAYATTGTWNETGGIVTYDHPGDIEWQNTNAFGGANWSAPVTGIALYDAAVGNVLIHFQDLDVASITMTPQKKMKIDLSTLIAT